MNKLFTILLLFIFTVTASAQTTTIIETGGWLESAYVKWRVDEDVDAFHVYINGVEVNDLLLDNQLVRFYGSYYRADALGLSTGIYTFKIVPVINGEERGGGVTTSPIQVEAHDRTGFAFANSIIPGAYQANGTPKNNAVILYITENTKNTISMDVNGANANPCIGLETILEGFKKGKDNRPLIVRLIGQITDPDYLNKGDIVIENKNNSSSYITVEGVGDDAVADGWGIRIKNASNVEVRNIGFMNTNSDEGDDLGLQQGNEYIWVHHCDFFYGDPGGDADQAKGDGALDCKKSTFVTFSYNHFWDTGKSNLLGLSEDTTEGYYITYHHNWYDHSDSRHPRVRFYSAHVYNNYYDGIAKYGVGATMGSSVFVEANYFRNCKYPILTSMQGSDVFDESSNSNDYSDMPTFSKEDGGSIKAYNNYMIGQRRFVPYGDTNYPNSTKDFDAWVAENRDDQIPSTVVSSFGGNSYNNFDSDAAVWYDYSPDSPEDAVEKVKQYAGRTLGGDFAWKFNNDTDDSAYAVNTLLKDALTNYMTSLISIQGDSISVQPEPEDTTSTELIDSDVVHNFTTDGLNSSFFVISGNLSDSKGTVYYNDLILSQCLKIESVTSLIFTTTKEATLTLVFNDNYTGNIKINGEKYAVTEGILSTKLGPGTYEITKDTTANLYYISLLFNTSVFDNSVPHFSVYPNPVHSTVTIECEHEIEKVEIISVYGGCIKTIQTPQSKIDLSSLQAGSYLLRISTNKGNYSKIILKQ